MASVNSCANHPGSNDSPPRAVVLPSFSPPRAATVSRAERLEAPGAAEFEALTGFVLALPPDPAHLKTWRMASYEPKKLLSHTARYLTRISRWATAVGSGSFDPYAFGEDYAAWVACVFLNAPHTTHEDLLKATRGAGLSADAFRHVTWHHHLGVEYDRNNKAVFNLCLNE